MLIQPINPYFPQPTIPMRADPTAQSLSSSQMSSTHQSPSYNQSYSTSQSPTSNQTSSTNQSSSNWNDQTFLRFAAKKPGTYPRDLYETAKAEYRGNLMKGAVMTAIGIGAKFISIPIPCCWIIIAPIVTIPGLLKLRKGWKQMNDVKEHQWRFEPEAAASRRKAVRHA